MKKTKHEFGYKFLRNLLLPIFKLYYNPKIMGAENIPQDGNILIVGNHKHLMDQCMPIMGTKRTIHWLAKREYFDDWKVSWFFKMSGCISVDRSVKDEHAKSEAMEVLEDGGAIGLFPEGTRNKTDQFLLPFKFGAVSMAKKTNSLIVPFGISGDYKFRSKNLIIIVGKPFSVEHIDLEMANEKLTKEVGKLIKKGQAIHK